MNEKENVNTILTTAFCDASKSSEIVHELSRKIKYITMSLSIFKDALSLDLGDDGIAYKMLYLELLIKFIKELGIPFICQINDSEFLKALELCYNENSVLKEAIDEIIALVGNTIGFGKDNLVMEEYFKFVKRINPNFKWIAREPEGDFENTVHEALKILRLCKDTNEALTKPPSKEFNREERISGAIKAIETLQMSTDLFKPGFKPIELEFIGDIILDIHNFEEDFFRMSKKAQKSFEETLYIYKHPQKSELPRQFESEQELHKRTYFVYNENLIPDEGECIEYKNYSYPFNEMIERTLQKTICSFLNQKGGRIYLGVHDDQKKVYGLTLTSKDRDSLKLNIYQMLNAFYPTISHEDFVKVICLPVYDNTEKAIPGRVVVKIIVKPGDREKIYSVTKSSLKCFIRKDGFCKSLDADQTVSLLKTKWSQPMDGRIDPKEFDDPKPEGLVDIKKDPAATKRIKQSQISNLTKNSKEEEKKQDVSPSKNLAPQSDSHDQDVKKKPEKKTLMDILRINPPTINPNHVTYAFKLKGIPSDTTEEEIVSLFPGVKLASKPYIRRSGKDAAFSPHAFINFSDLEIGIKQAIRINGGVKLRGNALEMLVKEEKAAPPITQKK